jgi:hypothetical protein
MARWVCVVIIVACFGRHAQAQEVKSRDLEPTGSRKGLDRDHPSVLTIDDTGIASPDFLNPRRPPKPGKFLAFRSNTNRVMTVTLTMSVAVGDADIPITALDAADGKKCKRNAANKAYCDLAFTLDPHTSRTLDVERLKVEIVPDDKTPAITVSLLVTLTNEKPANSTGYFAVSDNPREETPPPATFLALDVKSVFDPDPGTTASPILITDTAPFEGGRRYHFPATASIAFARSLGRRAKAEVEVGIKKGDFGSDDTTLSAVAQRFRFDFYSLGGVSLAAGRFSFAAPSSSIAVKEEGDGVQLAFRQASLAYLVHRESAANVANSANLDNSVFILQLAGLPVALGPVTNVSLLALEGTDRRTDLTLPTPARAARYDTFGGEAYLGFSELLTGSVAGYWSYRRPFNDSGAVRAHGSASMLTLTRSFVGDGKEPGTRRVLATLSAFVGYGTGDRGGTTTDEGYVGETAAFAPDLIFLKGLAKRTSTAGVGAFRPGLANKSYASVSVSTPVFSPLELIARLFTKGNDDDIASRGTALRYHVYRANETSRGASLLGHELDATFRIETPKDVKLALELGRFWPSTAARSAIHGHPWLASGTIAVKIP